MAAILLYDPKYPHNVGNVQRTAACFGYDAVYIYGTRVDLVSESRKGYRLPREERMKAYANVEVVQLGAKPFDEIREHRASKGFQELTPVAVEITETAIPMPQFYHPANPLYVFGPEDGDLGKVARQFTHQHVFIPTEWYQGKPLCMNLANAVGVTLYDRRLKQQPGLMALQMSEPVIR